MADPMDDDFVSNTRKPASVPTVDSGDVMDTSDDTNDPKSEIARLLSEISNSFHVGFESLPTEVQISHLNFQQDYDLDRFYQQLDQFLKDRTLDVFLLEYPDFRYIANKLFGERYPYLADPTLKDSSSRAPSLSSLEGLFTKSDSEANSEPELSNQTEPPVGNLRLVRTITSVPTSQLPQRSGSKDVADIPTLRLTGTRGPERAPLPPHESSITHPIQKIEARENRRTTRTCRGASTQNLKDSQEQDIPDYEILGDLPTMDLDSDSPTRFEQPSNAGWMMHWLSPVDGGPSGSKWVDTSGDVNLHDYKGWKIEAPKIMLTRAKHFLADEDVDRTVDWPRKFAELAEYFEYLGENFQGEDWGEDLHEAVKMLHTHWVFEQYHYGRPKLTLNFPHVWPLESKRLPRLPGTKITMEAEDSGGDDMGKRRPTLTKAKSAHDVQYKMPHGALRAYIKEYEFDARDFWASEFGKHAVRGDDPSLTEEDQYFNMTKCDNEYYDRCIQGGMGITSDLLKLECKFKFSSDDIIRQPSGPSKVSMQSLQSFSKFRGARRAALQQCLNMFDNAENRIACSPWNILVLPVPKVQDKPDPGIIFPIVQVKDIPEKEARDPFSYTMAHNWFLKEDYKWAQGVREHSIKGAYGERKWMRREDPIMDLPVNYKGPYVEHFMDTSMKTVFDLMRACGRLHQRLQRAQRWAPRDFLADVLKLIERGINNEDTAGYELKFRDKEYCKDSPNESDKDVSEQSEAGTDSSGQRESDEISHQRDEPMEDVSTQNEPGRDAENEKPSESSDLPEEFEERFSEHNSESEEELSKRNESGGRLPNLMYIRPEEEKWLYFLGGRSVNKKAINHHPTSNHLDRLFEGRVDEMLENIDTQALFRDTKSVTLDEFFAEINRGAQGPPQRHQFTLENTINHAKRLAKKGKLHGEQVVSRPSATYHPEDRVRWLTTDIYPDSKSTGVVNSQDQDQSDADSDWTISTVVTVPGPEDFGGYTAGMPRLKNIRTWEELDSIPKNSSLLNIPPATQNFFQCLAYRLGTTLRELRKKHRANRRRLDKAKKLQNREFVRVITNYWHGDASTLPNDPDFNKDKHGYEDITPDYLDVIQMAEPEAFDKDGKLIGGKEHKDHKVFRGIIREAYENKDMLFPTRVVLLKGADGTARDVSRREPVWAFAHPDQKPLTGRFWDINQWPLHLQSDETRKKIESSGPQPDPLASLRPVPPPQTTRGLPPPEFLPGWSTLQRRNMTPPEVPVVYSHSLPAQFAQEIDIPFSDPDVGRRGFDPRATEFWAGDTPLQRKVIEKSIRRVLEPAPETRRGLFSILSRNREPEDDPTALPDVDPRIIPKSKPRDPTPELEYPDKSTEKLVGESPDDVSQGSPEDVGDSPEVVEGTIEDDEEESLDDAREEGEPSFDENRSHDGDDGDDDDLYGVTPPPINPPSTTPANPTAAFWRRQGRDLASQSLDLEIIDSDSGQSSAQDRDEDMSLSQG
ncbi:hypothetical protein G7Z17_g12739 [Cylindrodendrum hubeiense]|uniref:Uncharacterized protein n=1 Tax=Cylindrodendrum hubeiense TaxID=595255 RepID=A0A9P5GXR0_9HYPO|nr:hypothetical protein G7Z17_g12739 [Cylindrodendrum hubeiense]